MRLVNALLVLSAAAAAAATPAVAGRSGLAIHGWLVPPATTTSVTSTVTPLSLAQLPVDAGYRWLVPAFMVPPAKPLTLAQLPILTSYPWAQPGTMHRLVPFGVPWFL